MKQKISTKKLVVAAMMAALTMVGSALRITLPLQIGSTTSFHLGNIMCALSGWDLGWAAWRRVWAPPSTT